MKLTSVVMIAAGASVSVGLCYLYLYKKTNKVVFNCSEQMDSRIQSFGSVVEPGIFGTRCFNKSSLRPRNKNSSAGTVLKLDWNGHIVLPPTMFVRFSLLSNPPVTNSRARILYPKAFPVVFQRALRDPEKVYALNKRKTNLVDNILSHQTFIYIRRGLFEKDNLIFLFICQVTIQVHFQENTMKSIEFKYFVTRQIKRLDEYIVRSGEQYQLCIDMLMQARDTATWNEFKYFFGNIILYGITNDCGRKLCRTYPGIYVNPNLFERDILFSPNIECIYGLWSSESPIMRGLNSNVEIITPTRSKKVFQAQLEVKHRECDRPAMSITEKVRQALNGILGTIPEPSKLMDIISKIEEQSPHVIDSLKECVRMNGLVKEMKRSLKDLRSGLKGEMSMTADMAELEECLFMDKVPPSWEKLDYPSLLPLPAWHGNLLRRFCEIESRVKNFQIHPQPSKEETFVMEIPALTRKPMKKFPKNPSEYHPVLLLNQLIPGIQYHTVVISNPPSVVDVQATISGASFFGRVCRLRRSKYDELLIVAHTSTTDGGFDIRNVCRRIPFTSPFISSTSWYSKTVAPFEFYNRDAKI